MADHPDNTQRIDVERLRELATELIAADESGDGMRTSAAIDALDAELTPDVLLALLQQLAELQEQADRFHVRAESYRKDAEAAERARDEANRAWRNAFVGVAEAALVFHDGMDAMSARVRANEQADRVVAFLAASGGDDNG